jgi:hypothetical protein
MAQDRTRLAVMAGLLLTLVLALIFSWNSQHDSLPAPTIDVGDIQTRAVMSFAQGLTGTAMALPTSTGTNTLEPTSSAASTQSTDSVSPTPSCYRLKFDRDVSIPDNTPMTPAQVFTKTWQVENTGICAWRQGFKLVLIGGLAMGGSPFIVASTVNPGARLEISIKMAAPTDQTGIVEGTWRMSDENGILFGDALTVVIVVSGTTEPAPTAGATTTP